MFTAKSVFILSAQELEYEFDEETMGEYVSIFDKAISILKKAVGDNRLELTEDEIESIGEAYSVVEQFREQRNN